MKKGLIIALSLVSAIGYAQQGEMLNVTSGSNEYVDLGNNAARNFGNSGSDFTIEFWYLDSDGTAELLANSNGFLTAELNGGNLEVFISDGTNSSTLTHSSITASYWHHVAIRVDNVSGSTNDFTLYVDGAQSDSARVTTWNPDLNSGQYYLAAHGTTSTSASASFDEVRFWNEKRVLDDLKWYKDDTLSFSDTRTQLVGYFTMNDITSDVLTDSSATGANGSVANATVALAPTTAPVPYYTVATGDLFTEATWATGQGVPDVPNSYTKIWLRNTYNNLESGDPDLNVGALIIDYDTTGAGFDTRSAILRTRGGVNAYSFSPVVGDLVIRGAGHHISNTMTVTRSITSQSRPGNCAACGNAELYVNGSGKINFQGTTINYRNGTIHITGIVDVLSSAHTLNFPNTTINIEASGLLISEATGSNTWNLAGSTLNIKYGGGISNTQHATSPVTGNPTITIESEIGSSADGWRHFSSPNNGGTLTDFNDDLTFNFAGSSTYNAYYWDASENGSSGNANGWTAITSTAHATSTPFVIYEDSNFPALAGGTIDIANTSITSGDQTTNIYNFYDPEATTNAQNKGWNLISNPYPGAVSIQAVINDYDGDGVDNAADFPLAYQAIHVWDARNGQYRPYLASGETVEIHDNSSGSTGSGSTANSTTYIRPFQAFWVKMTDGDAATEFVLKNEHRYTLRMVSGNQEFHKSVYPKLRLNVFGPDSAIDQSLVVFNPNTDDTWNSGHEAYDIHSMNPNVPSMWIPSAEGNQSIYSTDLPTGSTKAIPVVIEAGTPGIHSLNFVEDDYHSSYDVWVVDSVAQKTHDMWTGSYNFMIPNSGDSRTLWIFASANNIGMGEFEATRLYVYQLDDSWRVDVGEENITGYVELLDMSGRVLNRVDLEARETDIAKPSQQGVYLLRWVRPGKSTLVEKVVNL